MSTMAISTDINVVRENRHAFLSLEKINHRQLMCTGRRRKSLPGMEPLIGCENHFLYSEVFKADVRELL